VWEKKQESIILAAGVLEKGSPVHKCMLKILDTWCDDAGLFDPCSMSLDNK
jgi:hypothetical protein